MRSMLLLIVMLFVACSQARMTEPAKTVSNQSGQIPRLVNDILRYLNPDSPEPIFGSKQYSEKQRTFLNQAVKDLIAATDASWTESVAKVKANAKDEEAADGEDRKLVELAVDLRLEAVRPIYLARKALREVAERGERIGLESTPAREALKAFITKNHQLLLEWDYDWGDYHAYLHAFIMDLAGDGVRFGLAKAEFQEVEADMLKTVAMDVERDFGSSAAAEDVRNLQARTWGSLFTWYRDLGREVDPKFWQRGAEKWEMFKALSKSPRFRLSQSNRERAIAVAQAYLSAGRMFVAMGDKDAALTVFSAVAETRSNPLTGNAQEWIGRLRSTF